MDILSLSVWCFIIFIVGQAIYNLYFSPLAKFPGPFLAKISSWPNFYFTLTGKRHIWIWQCHQLYGEAFRFKPDGVLFNTSSAYQAIHPTRANVKKATFYKVWPRNAHNLNTLNTVDKMLHARKRRILNSAFSANAIRSAEPFVIKHIDRWCELLVQSSDGTWTKPKNMSELTDFLMFDIIGELCFGKSFELKEPGENPFREMPHTTTKYVQLMYRISQSPIVKFWVWLKPRGLDPLIESALPTNVREFYGFIEKNVSKRIEEEEKIRNQGSEAKRKDMLHYLFNATDESGKPSYTNMDELHGEANLLFVAGLDTTATTLTAIWFYIIRYPQCYERLTDEIRKTFQSAEDIQLDTLYASCPYLQACVSESMRMCPVLPSEMPREVLPGGIVIDGNHIPEGYQVGVSGWSIMHHEEHFKDPWVFRPERWIAEAGVTKEDVARAQQAFHPFSIGVGNCVGQKLAMEEMLLTVSKTLYLMDIRLAPGDEVGGGHPDFGWGLRDKNQMRLEDAYVALRNGPMVQFAKRTL